MARDTYKVLFQLPGGHTIEAVLMLYDKRRTLCISSQAGCAMGCTFCATALGGLARNLTAGEIVAQVLYFARYWRCGAADRCGTPQQGDQYCVDGDGRADAQL